MTTHLPTALPSSLEPAADSARLHEALHHDIKPFCPGARVIGRALAVRCHPGDSLTLHPVIARAHEIQRTEAAILPPVRPGALTPGLLGLRPALREPGTGTD